VNYLKKSGIDPVMIADSNNIHTQNAAVKLGIVKNLNSAEIFGDEKINNMGDTMFYINADKIRLFTPTGLSNRIKFLKALQFKNKSPAITINDMSEMLLLNEPCVSFTSVSTETGVLKNKAAVITKNLTVSTIAKAVKDSVLIYRNTCKILHFVSVLFISQYLLVIFAVLLNGAYILNPAQIILAGICGYISAISLCFGEQNKQSHILRNKIKNYKEPKKLNRAIIKYGFFHGLLIFALTVISFFICLIIKNPGPDLLDIPRAYINSGADLNINISAAQTSAFIAYIVSCILVRFIKFFKRGLFFER